MDRLINYLFAILLLGLFVLQATANDKIQIITALVLSGIICFVAFLFRWLTLGGAKAAFIVGTYTYGLGGVLAAVLLIVFFLTGSWLSKINGFRKRRDSEYNHFETRRNGLQVWANSFWFTLFLGIFYLSKQQIWFMAAVAAIATATADTWATEIGTFGERSRAVLILNFNPVRVGENGGISLKGTISGLFGSVLIGLLYFFIAKPPYMILFILVALSGFLGCVFDSYLGAIFQFKGKSIYVPGFPGRHYSLGNNAVNFTAIGLSSITMLLMIGLLNFTNALV